MNPTSTVSPTNKSEQLVRPAKPKETAAIAFPQSGYIGVAAKFADVYSQQYESPKEFLYFDCLALIGAIISGRVRADFDLPCQPRFYAVKVAKSAWRRKSTSTRMAEKFVRGALEVLDSERLRRRDWPQTVYGVGSGEGLARCLGPTLIRQGKGKAALRQTTRKAVLVFDEFRRFEAKANIKNSSLLPMVNELYERNEYDNVTKAGSDRIVDGHLVFLANSTEETYKDLLDAPEFRDIGFLNRLLVIASDSRKRVAKPKAPPASVVGPIQSELANYLASLPPLNGDGSASREVVIPLTPGAMEMWGGWYVALEETDETARLDNLGMRLMGLLAFSSGRSQIDEQLLGSVLDILGYERQVRSVYKPIEAENPWAKMEQKIRHVLAKHGPLTERDIRRYTNADRAGLKIFKNARLGLKQSGEIQRVEGSKWKLV